MTDTPASPPTTPTTPTTPSPEQPAQLIAGKFKDEAALKEAITSLAKHEKIGMPELASVAFENTDRAVAVYKRLESMLGRPATPAPDATSLELGRTQAAPTTPMSMQELIAGLGVQQEKLNEAVLKGGKPSEDVYAQFGKAVITLPDGTQRTLGPDIVDQFLGAQAKGAQYQQVIMDQAAQHVGGKDKLNALIAFGDTLPPTMQQSINIELGDASTMKSGLDRLNQLYLQSVGAAGSNGIVSDTSGAVTNLANQPFKTHAEMKQFRKEKGENDPVYKSRLAATPVDVLNRVA